VAKAASVDTRGFRARTTRQRKKSSLRSGAESKHSPFGRFSRPKKTNPPLHALLGVVLARELWCSPGSLYSQPQFPLRGLRDLHAMLFLFEVVLARKLPC
jgi:hypothetical protein